jgi:hypothetical protein
VRKDPEEAGKIPRKFVEISLMNGELKRVIWSGRRGSWRTLNDDTF